MQRSRVIKALADIAGRAMKEVDTGKRPTIAGITLALPGIVETATGTLRFAPNLGWRDEPVAERLAAAIGLNVPVSLDNEANLAALAEYRAGEHAGTPNLIYLMGEVGIGAGIVVNGQVLRGAYGYSSEVGHMAMVDGGAACGCGSTGCWETIIGLHPLLRDAVPDLAPALIADASMGPEQKVAYVKNRAADGDEVALEALERHGQWVGRGLSNLVNIFNPSVISLGGFFQDIAPWVLPSAESVLAQRAMAPDGGGVKLVLSRLGFSGAVLGGAIHAAEWVFSDPTSVPTR
jgi:predicted NBD/HSP70 family sugar kinase